jgi:hypothetical protein
MNVYDMPVKRLNRNIKAFLKETTFGRYFLVPVNRRVQRLHERVYKARLRNGMISRKEFIEDLRNAIENKRGYAAGKIGYSEQHWMYYEILLGKEKDPGRVREFEKMLLHHGFNQEGIFPPSPEFYLEFNKTYIQHVRNIDCLGICYRPWEREIIGHYRLSNKLIYYPCHEPFVTFGHRLEYFRPEDRSDNPYWSADDSCYLFEPKEDNCYLEFFAGKKILLICPFAGFLKKRANQQTFEAVWSKTGRKWFYPESVEAIEFPYGFESETQREFGTALRLYERITAKIEEKEFDVALIAAAGLAIPIASHVKDRGKVAIELGGHLQILFGVLGKRWLGHKFFRFWNERYYNEHWINMPFEYRPNATGVCDGGAYW